MPIRLQSRINGVQVEFMAGRFEQLNARLLDGADLLIGTDICFWDEMVDPLYKLLRRAGNAGVTQAIIGDPGRPPFWSLAQRVEEKLGGRVLAHASGRRGSAPKQLLITDFSKLRL